MVSFTDASNLEMNKTLLVVSEIMLRIKKCYDIIAGEQDACFEFLLETFKKSSEAYFMLEGTLLGEKISHSKRIVINANPVEIFVQTDKYLYKPGQLVQFRILTVQGPFLGVLTNKVSYVDVLWVFLL